MLQLKALRDSFREQLPGRIAKVEAVWREVADHGWDDQSVMRLRHLLHSLTGAAGTFGFVEFSGAARALECAIDGV
ncbi:MAG: Hpt domain-containing protein, partial [Burkholderiales bacterium]